MTTQRIPSLDTSSATGSNKKFFDAPLSPRKALEYSPLAVANSSSTVKVT